MYTDAVDSTIDIIWKFLLYRLMNVEICPEMQVNEIHALYDKHHKVSPFLKSH